MNWDEFLTDRNEALLSLDKKKILAYYKKWDVDISKMPKDDVDFLFWVSIHKARTALKTLPMEARIYSKKWLHGAGFRSMDDGDVPLEAA